MNFNKNDYEIISDKLKTSSEILYAIEEVAGEKFKIDDDNSGLIKNYAYWIWDTGCDDREDDDKLFSLLPTDDIAEGDKLLWGDDDVIFKNGIWDF